MSRIRKIIVAGATFSVALGIGFVMQNGDVLAARFGEVPVAAQADGGPAFPPAPLPVALEPAPDLGPVARPQPRPQDLASLRCDVVLTGQALPAGLVNLTLAAPCAPLAQVTIHHAGMMFGAQTDALGQVMVTAPALDATAVFMAEIGSASAVAVVAVAGLDRLDRAVLQWQGDSGLGLHALEAGAAPGGSGHVWSGAPSDPVAALQGTGGFLLELGDPALGGALLAQVYTVPHDAAALRGDVQLSVAAAVTAGNCGGTISAQTIQIAPGIPPAARDLTVTLPGCDSLGATVVLDRVLAPVHLAAQ